MRLYFYESKAQKVKTMVEQTVDRISVASDQNQYQRDLFRTLLKWVAAACSVLSFAYLVPAVQQGLWTGIVVGLDFLVVAVYSVSILWFIPMPDFISSVRAFLALATWTVFAYGLLQPIAYIHIMALGATIVIALAVSLETAPNSYRWSIGNILAYIVVGVSRMFVHVPELDLGGLQALVLYATPIAVLIILSELGRVTTQHFKTSLIYSEQVRQQLELQKKQLMVAAEKLERSNRELQDFAYVASHDLQEPLRKIQAFGSRLKAKITIPLDQQTQEYLERMLNAASRMQRLVEDLLAYSRVTTKPHPFSRIELGHVIAEVLSDLEIQIERNKATVDVGELPSIEADENQIKELFQNLISNAIKYRKIETTPIVKITSKIYNPDLLLESKHPKLCQISVQDNGLGFDMKYAERIFGMFERLHGRNEYDGSGIGLAICRKIAERHGGRIEVSSQEGVGSTFIVFLPYSHSHEM